MALDQALQHTDGAAHLSLMSDPGVKDLLLVCELE